MNTGTPLDLTPFGSVLTGMSVAYWLLALGALALALVRPKRFKDKAFWVGFIVVAFGFLPAIEAWSRYKAQQKLNVAMARFEERCKTAGEKISRTVEGVEGILLMKVRPAKPSGADSDPMWPDAGVPDRTGDDYIMSFLRNTELQPEYRNPDGKPLYPGSSGYRFVDVIDPSSGVRTRYIAPFTKKGGYPKEGVQTLTKTEIDARTPKFGLNFEPFLQQEDRKFWIAGGVIRVVDLASNEVMAEKTGFLIDTGQGSTAGFRSPWGWAHSYGPRCPQNWAHATPGRSFIDQVLKPKKGE